MKNDGGHSMKLTLEGIKNREAWEKQGSDCRDMM